MSTERCCEAGDCQFRPEQTRKILNHLRWCSKVGVDAVESAGALRERDSAPVLSGQAREFDSGTGDDDSILDVVAVQQAIANGANKNNVRSVCKALCPFALE